MPFTILYIEDDAVSREKTALLLKELSRTLIVAVDGEDGLNKLKTNSVDLIITDLEMPKLDGMSFIKRVRLLTHPKKSTLPIIITSIHNEIKALHASIEYGVQAFIVKPISFTLLQQAINKIKNQHWEKMISSSQKNNRNNHLDFGEYQLINYLQTTQSSIVLLIKIDEFKYLDLSLTSKISKKLQKRFAKKLLSLMPNRCHLSKIYILEKGEFVFTKPSYEKDLEKRFIKEMKSFHNHINSAKIKIGLVDYTLSIVSSLAYGENAYENAKIGMKKILQTKQEFIIATNLHETEKYQARKKLKKFTTLKNALDSYNILSYFQPIINNQTKEIEKYESLVRMIDEKGKILSPIEFLSLAKEGNYYQKITSQVLENSFQALYSTDKEISINLSSLDIEKRETRDEFIYLLNKHRQEGHRIIIELLEDEEITNNQMIKKFISEVKKFNVKIAIDDFGTGLSNFSRVYIYQPDFIKIDGSLVKNITQDHLSRSMIETIVAFSKKEKIKTIAEFVEDETIFNLLTKLGVDYSQGYYFGKAQLL